MTADALGLSMGRPFTRADLAEAPDDGHRYEIIDGALIVSPAPKIRHQRMLRELSRMLIPACPAELEVLFAPVDVVLDDDTVIQPDLLVARTASFTDSELSGVPLLAVEILSPSTRGIDLLLKRDRLQRAGCPSYWVLDPEEPSLTAWELVDGTYHEVAHVTKDDVFESTAPFPVTFSPASLIA